MQKFFIISRSRTGSNMVKTMLGSHPDIHVEGEIFGRLNDLTENEILEKLFTKGAGSCAVGCKVFYYHPQDGDPSKLFSLLHEIDDAKFLHLTRTNILASILSSEIASARNKWSSTQTAEEDEYITVSLDSKKLMSGYKRTVAFESLFREIFHDRDVTELTYEEMREHGAMRLLPFLDKLGVARRELTTPLVRQRTQKLADCISNVEELQHNFPTDEYPRIVWTD